MIKEKIKFNQQREFGDNFNIAVKFIRENFKMLMQSLLYIAGPFILLASIANVMYSHSITSTITDFFRNQNFKVFDLINYQYFISFIVTAISNLIITAIVFEFMFLYNKKETETITVGMVGRAILRDFWKLALTMLTFYLVAMLVIVVFGGITIGLSNVHWSFSIIIAIVIIILLILFGANTLYLLSTTYLVRIFGTESVILSFSITRRAMKGNFWWTWLLMLCLYVISLIIGTAMNIPAAIIQVVINTTSMNLIDYKDVFSIITVITSTLHILLTAFLLIFIAFHHFSLVEKKEGVGLLERINEIGQIKKQNVDQEY